MRVKDDLVEFLLNVKNADEKLHRISLVPVLLLVHNYPPKLEFRNQTEDLINKPESEEHGSENVAQTLR